ncbi:cobalt transporter [Palaeococcus pacificus DY20341]|uniref:Cobalt transporter n=1 Tax=Palaeococcus pacificus DY20341 TaxID=1343739 RepID=A0A075LRN6_9EURY|nr:PDGLE domain-containing protein [Palaeococcus pacificus]AIF68776.1 cobalt transporter [Palaeococcus pacificus DY20341]
MRAILKGLIIIIVLLAIALPFASENPDGLEATMEKVGLEEHAFYEAPLDYGETWGQSLVMGMLGIVLVFALSYGLTKVFKGV